MKGQQPPVRLKEPGHHVPDCSVDMVSHYSFDFAQQVHYPSNPQQPGPIYFKTPRKCGIFGVMAEAIPQMALFLLDEAVDTGKGANTVISFLDFFFENYGLKETECHLHADNCTGQNKNNAMLQYLLWRVMTKRHSKITLSFLVAGHTKFSPDWCFGLFKRTFRRTKVDCLNDIVDVAQRCSPSGIVVPQLCGTEDGSPLVPVRNWSSFLDTWFRKLVGLKKLHHIEFLASGEVHVRLTCDADRQVINLLKGDDIPSDDVIAPIIKPPGLSQQRSEYLYNDIREFVAVEHQDLVCPPPVVSQQPACSASAILSP